MVGEIIHFGANVRRTRGLRRSAPLTAYTVSTCPWFMPCDGDDVQHPGLPSVRYKGIPSGAKDGVG
jgi:hypothetical protein